MKYMVLESCPWEGFYRAADTAARSKAMHFSLLLNFATENNLGAMEKVKDTQKQTSGMIKSLFCICLLPQLCFVLYRCPM